MRGNSRHEPNVCVITNEYCRELSRAFMCYDLCHLICRADTSFAIASEVCHSSLRAFPIEFVHLPILAAWVCLVLWQKPPSH